MMDTAHLLGQWAGRRTVGTLVVAMAAFVASAPGLAHEGHDDEASAPPAAVSAIAPRRLPDGTLALPKPSQRQLEIRTVVVERAAVPRAVELPGLVAVDPNAGGRVQASVAGRIKAGREGLPTVGQAVQRGQVLATVYPTVDPIARSTQAAQLAELRAARALTERRVARLRDLADTVPRKEIEAAESELQSLGGRLAALSGGLAAAEALTAPVSGVVASANVVVGQVVDAREVLFEIVDPTRMRIEATGFDVALAGEIADASVSAAGQSVPLSFVGAGRVLRDQAIPLVFRAKHPALTSLAVGQPVVVTVRLRSATQGTAVPAGAVVRGPSNEPTVWVKTQAERFEPRPVQLQPLDAQRVLVVAGLQGRERVVVQGAALLSQVR